ncbi:MAG TPA: D-2-hydroxyacid dehydrogenase [Candidatus Binatia bacterium]|nr:D-2-hydroxyacid dehydrogenase [Candidatus Binatia bacterium]
MPRIVVLDGLTLDPGDNPWDELAALGDLEVHDRSADDEIVPRARGAEIVLTNKTHLSAESLARLPELRFVAVLATGYDVVDVAEAARRGVVVSNVPEYGTESVAQHVLALVLELASAVGEHAEAVRAGDWIRAPDFCFWRRSPIELAGLAFGVVGFGRIGRRVGELAHALGMSVLASGRPGASPPDVPWRPFAWRTTAEVFAESDVVSLHAPLGRGQERLVDRAVLATMKPSAFLINAARGALVDEAALADALERRVIAGAALDVVAHEPMLADNPLRTARNCIITPHIAWATLAARRRLMQTAVGNVRAYLAGAPINVVS